MATSEEKLKSLSTDKLIDVVKNYKQYGYEISLRDYALSILEDRGYDNELLEKTGNLDNRNYKSAQDLFKSFNKNSLIAILTKLIFVISNVLNNIYSTNTKTSTILFMVLNFILLAIYLLFLVRSFIDQNHFYTTIGKGDISESVMLFLFIGVFFYIFYYFYLRKQMREQMRFID
jgi:hypothetical protein